MKKLRFAALVRVSDISQAGDKKTSLAAQTRQVEAAAKSLKGTIVKLYKGTEHGMPDFERKLLDELIADSSKGIFDAVIVSDLSRWSRDNKRSKGDIEILKANKIRFFVGSMEYNLLDPGHRFLLGVTTETSQFFAETQSLKMIMGKINGSKKGVHTVGPRPYGRYYDRKSGKWGINELEQHKIQKAVQSYLSGEATFANISKVCGIGRAGLYHILKNTLGDKWPIHFRSEKWGIDELVMQTIPRLVSEETEGAVLAKIEANKTYAHGQQKRFYLLGRMAFCGHCNRALEGHTVSNWSYYRHKNRECAFQSIRTELIDGPVMNEIFELFGDVNKRAESMRNAVTDLDEVERQRKNLEHLEKRLDAVGGEEDRLLNIAAKGLFTVEKIEKKIADIRTRETTIRRDIETTKKELDTSATEEQIKRMARDFKYKELASQIEHSYHGSEAHLKELTKEEKRSILQTIFVGRFVEDGEERRYGVYIKKGRKGWLYTVRGAFPQFKVVQDDFRVDSNSLD